MGFAMPGAVSIGTGEDKQARGRELAHRTRMSDGSAKRGTDRSDRDAQHGSSGRPAAYKALRRVAKTLGQEGRRPALQRCARVRLAHRCVSGTGAPNRRHEDIAGETRPVTYPRDTLRGYWLRLGDGWGAGVPRGAGAWVPGRFAPSVVTKALPGDANASSLAGPYATGRACAVCTPRAGAKVALPRAGAVWPQALPGPAGSRRCSVLPLLRHQAGVGLCSLQASHASHASHAGEWQHARLASLMPQCAAMRAGDVDVMDGWT